MNMGHNDMFHDTVQAAPRCEQVNSGVLGCAHGILHSYSPGPECGVVYVAVTGRKRTLFHCKWANLSNSISIIIIEYFIENHSRFSMNYVHAQ